MTDPASTIAADAKAAEATLVTSISPVTADLKTLLAHVGTMGFAAILLGVGFIVGHMF